MISRYRLPLIIISVLGFSHFVMMLLNKEVILSGLGWFGLPLWTLFQTISSIWFVLIPAAVMLMFYDRTMTIQYMVPLLILIIIMLKAAEVAFTGLPDV
ncbi:hypothetical protein Metev_0618 [Methanohalobium evestigatum Z-7303]|jgi:hypothetical protein|uniref:Uncharacterized protein n=1 Tax=Methanohalobium evestigatum (strain ATCC BAA-1072 / DSM 3721 / NBRC 107634 / OCM 161 / Z-7303) TaxID=644295 RepID=D7E8I2_METEZ|nr:hypothetical protein [Methanohalobium evestigatum]ADI73524.1 hypothetical protein Metev_0618 [Methanohalobium evestigatum Z-7303]